MWKFNYRTRFCSKHSKNFKFKSVRDFFIKYFNIDLNSIKIINVATQKNQNIEFSNLSIICCGASIITEPLYLFESNKFKNFLDHARKSYDFVVLDAPPVPIFSDFRILCNLVDGVVLVRPVQSNERRCAVGFIAYLRVSILHNNCVPN